jgi:hypothetical protein
MLFENQELKYRFLRLSRPTASILDGRRGEFEACTFAGGCRIGLVHTARCVRIEWSSLVLPLCWLVGKVKVLSKRAHDGGIDLVHKRAQGLCETFLSAIRHFSPVIGFGDRPTETGRALEHETCISNISSR